MLSSVVFASIIVSGHKFVFAIKNIIFLHIPCYSEYLAESLYAFMFNKTIVIAIVIVTIHTVVLVKVIGIAKDIVYNTLNINFYIQK